MDDIVQIRDNEVVKNWRFAESGSLAWTHLWFSIQSKLFGGSLVGYHAVNWLLHTTIGCVLLGFGREFLKGRYSEGTAWFAALLFVVHPLGSEIPNYARCQDLAWVTLFSLLATWALHRFIREGGWWKLMACAVFGLGAALSKGPGLFHALMMTGAVGLVSISTDHWRWIRRHALVIGGAVGISLLALWLCGVLQPWASAMNISLEPRFVGHAYTLARVFWEFAWRSIIPVGLSSDHHIAETMIRDSYGIIADKTAILAAWVWLGVTCFSVFLMWKKSTRLIGVCLFLYIVTILFRVLYLIPEFMPEYRIYPGLPWFALLAAILLSKVWKFLTPASARIPALFIIVTFAFLSAKRSFLWHDLERLTADVLKQYPTQARAIWELHDRDLDAHQWQKVIDRQRQVWPEVARKFHAENIRLAPGRELPTGHFALAEVACAGRYARALAGQGDAAAGLREMKRLQNYMRQLGLDPVAHALHWQYFTHDLALVHESAGNDAQALALLTKLPMTGRQAKDYRRIKGKINVVKQDL